MSKMNTQTVSLSTPTGSRTASSRLPGAWLRASGMALVSGAALALGACSGGGGAGGTGGGGQNTGNAQLERVVFGRLVDVYGLRESPEGKTVDLVQTDVLIGPDIQDERPPTSNKRDEEVLYDFISANPDNLQPRLLITREIGSTEFNDAFTNLGRRLKEVTPGLFGQEVSTRPFTVVPRNIAFELQFSQSLGIGDDFFVVRDAQGRVVGVRNTEAVQLLEIVGDPWDADPRGDFKVIPTRVVVRGSSLIVDPVLLGSEGAQYQVRNNASGMPESPDLVGANIRIAVALAGPLAIPGVSEVGNTAFVGTNNQAFRSIVRDFRSGNSRDNSADIARGFVRDAEPPRIVGEILMFLASVEDVDPSTQVVRLYKNERSHELDRGDVVRFIDPSTGDVFGTSEIVADPEDAGDPGMQIVRTLVRRVPGLDALDPRNLPGYPGSGPGLEAWLRANAPKVVLVAEFTASRISNEVLVKDEPVNFLAFSPSPLPLQNGDPSPPNQNISPFAEAIIRFTKPVDMATVRAFDSFFFATRDVLDDETIRTQFLEPRNLDPERFNKDKFITPHLVAARVIDEDGSQTSIRLQPTKGFFLNEEMRTIDEGQPFESKRFKYAMHLVGGSNGVRDLAGNPIDFQSQNEIKDFLVVEFSLDTRKDPNNRPLYADNLVVSIVRRYEDEDEDEQPSLYLPGEAAEVDPNSGSPLAAPPEAYPLQDIFGAVVYLAGGKLQARPTTRVTKVVDDLNQQPPPSQESLLRFCPDSLGGEGTVASNSAGVRFGQPIQNPLNPYGSRLQTVWREIDMSLSRIDPFDFNLDVEQMYWAPFTNGVITYDEFDRVSLFLGHSEWRPEPCVGAFSALPELPDSGLKVDFADNYAHNKAIGTGAKTDNPAPHPAYVDQRLVIDAALAFTEPNGINRFLPLPEFEKPYFVWRDETVPLQGANSGRGSDVVNANNNMRPYIVSPFLGGVGRYVTGTATALQFNLGRWYNVQNYQPGSTSRLDTFTGGLVGTIALPLLADFWTYCDDPDLPEGNGFIATGFNGWQIALSVQSSPQPNFRAYSGGFAGSGTRNPICVSPSDAAWTRAAGGYTPAGSRTGVPVDNSVYWVMADFLKRQTVVTSGFVDVFNPHRMPARVLGEDDPRLGPYLVDQSGNSSLPPGTLPQYDWFFEPPLESLPGGTAIIPEFRAATVLDPDPFSYSTYRGLLNWQRDGVPAPDETNFPLDPLKAGDAGIKKYDNRTVGSAAREWWMHFYNRNVSEYTREVGNLSDDEWTSQFAGPNETFNARDVRYFNWRFIMRNNVDASPPISPQIESYAMTYRFERGQ